MSISAELPRTGAARYGADDRLTGMTAAHAAFRRDLTHLAAVAAGPGQLTDPVRRQAVMNGWGVFKNQMRKHHHAEDHFIWPRLRLRLAASQAALSVLAEMDAEHERIDPLLAAVDVAFADRVGGDVAGAIGELVTVLSGHLAHEERDAIPMIGEALSDEEWAVVTADIRQHGMSSVAEYLPWLTDSVSPQETEQIMGLLPPPLRIVYRQEWKPSYDGVRHW